MTRWLGGKIRQVKYVTLMFIMVTSLWFLGGCDMSGTFHNCHMTHQFNKSRAFHETGISDL